MRTDRHKDRQTGGRTHMTKLSSFRNFSKELKKGTISTIKKSGKGQRELDFLFTMQITSKISVNSIQYTHLYYVC